MSKHIPPGAGPGAQPVYQTRPLRAHVDDSYKLRGKPHEPSVCRECGAVFHDGHWSWVSCPANAHELLCPACHRIQDNAPAGYLRLQGAFFSAHRTEVMVLLRNVEKREKAEHPMQRIMGITEANGTVLVNTTDSHLAHGLGSALHHAYQGELESEYGEGENMVRVNWKR